MASWASGNRRSTREIGFTWTVCTVAFSALTWYTSRDHVLAVATFSVLALVVSWRAQVLNLLLIPLPFMALCLGHYSLIQAVSGCVLLVLGPLVASGILASVAKPTSRARPTRDIWSIWVGCMVAFGALTWYTSESHLWAIASFAVLAFVVSRRARVVTVVVAAALPLLGTQIGHYSLLQGVVGAAILVVGPILVTFLIALVEATVKFWYDDPTRTGKAAATMLFAQWARGIAIAAAIIGAVFERGFSVSAVPVVAAVAVPSIAFAHRLRKTAVAFAIVGSWATGWSVTPLALGALCLALELLALARRPPRQWHPVPQRPGWWSIATRIRCAVCDGRIKRGDLLGARNALRSARPESPAVKVRMAFIEIEERRYQVGLDLGPVLADLPSGLRLPAQLVYARALSGIGQHEAARSVFKGVMEKLTDSRRQLRSYVTLLMAENDYAAGDTGKAEQALAQLDRTDGLDYYMRLRVLHLLARCAIAKRDINAAKAFVARAEEAILANGYVRRLLLDKTSGRVLFGSRGSAYLRIVEQDVVSRRINPEYDYGWDPDAVMIAMSMANRSDSLVDLCMAEAFRTEAQDPTRAQALAARALMELDRTRYRLTAQSSRTSWSRTFREAAAYALDLAHRRGDHLHVAELIEFARTQTLPVANGEANGDLVLSTPPAILVRGRTRLVWPGDDRPAAIDLEHAASVAAGPGSWWLAYWDAGQWLYWALVAPLGGDVHSGRLNAGPDSDLARSLADLGRALPILRPGEKYEAMEYRVQVGPLVADPHQELALAQALGRLLLPQRLGEEAVKAYVRGTRLRLAIAPSASVGYVPWSLLAIGPPESEGPSRLIELSDWVLAPSASLLACAAPRKPQRSPLRLAIADTVDAPDLGFGRLDGARKQAKALARDGQVTVLGGAHPEDSPATIEEFERQLAAIGPDSTIAFLCHAKRGTSDEPSTGGIVMASASGYPPSILTPARLLETSQRARMPAQVLLQACDTSALSDATSGEWLTIAPAFIAGGASEVLSTLYPLPDRLSPDDPLLAAARGGRSLKDAARDMQRHRLAVWSGGRSVDDEHIPLAWAAYAPIAVDGLVSAGDRELAVAPRQDAVPVSDNLIRALNESLDTPLPEKVARVDSARFIGGVLEVTDIADILDGGVASLRPAALVWRFGLRVLALFVGRQDGPTVTFDVEGKAVRVSTVVVDCMREARRAAARDGVRLQAEHVALALLKRPTAARRLIRIVSRLTRRNDELVARALVHILAASIAGAYDPTSPRPRDSRMAQLVDAILADSREPHVPRHREPSGDTLRNQALR